ncbi:uncharacterized protein LOC122968134 [Thunnus albacares]|uniref:uncharacterized protein LOC122968134 n=1 Tax=Thunnus albacares TaxID=8236 RepID=UPI001CF6585D|nr:uncharacterized protein LOC122968134 [Thunnus albacares]
MDMASKHEDYLLENAKIDDGPPVRYLLPPKKRNLDGETDKESKLRRWTFGEKDPDKPNKTILLVGETGSGKSTLINAMCNYVMGIKFEDQEWFEVIDEREKDTQSQSQTSEVTVYEIFGYEGKIVPYSLTVIDTPGYGDTRGIEYDAVITQKLHALFCSEGGVQEINAVGLVLKASDNRLSDRLIYIFDSVTSLFGKDMEVKIVALITHSDGMPPTNALKALEDAKIEFAKNEKNQPVHFVFNNCQSTVITEKTEFGLKQAWARTKTGMDQFTAFLEKTAPQNLEKTVEVMKERIRLAACINNLTEKIKLIELKKKEIQETLEGLEKQKEALRRGDEVEIEVDEPSKEKESIDGGMWLVAYSGAVCCTVCEENCHYPGCTWAWYPGLCEVMKGGHCTVCTGKCPASDHVKERKKYVIKTRKVKKTVGELKQSASELKQNNEADEEQNDPLLSNLQREKEKLEKQKDQLLDKAYQHVEKLEQIALNVNSLFTHVHLDPLIKMMEDKGDKQKVEKLKKMKSRVDEGILAAMRYRLKCFAGKVTAFAQVVGKGFKNLGNM